MEINAPIIKRRAESPQEDTAGSARLRINSTDL